MNIEISTRNSNPLNIFLKSKGDKLVYSTAPQKEPIVKTIPSISLHKNEESQPKQIKQVQSQQNQINQNQPRDQPRLSNQKQEISRNQNQPKEHISQKVASSLQNPPKDPNKFRYKPSNNSSSSNINATIDQAKKQAPKNDRRSNKSKKAQQIQFIDSVQNLINIILSKPPEKMIKKLKSKIDLLNRMIHSLISYDDKLLNQTKVFISYIKLFLHDSIVSNPQMNRYYSIFFKDNIFIIGQKLLYFFNSNVDPHYNSMIIQFLKRLSEIFPEKGKIILSYMQSIINSNQINLLNQTRDILCHEIEEIEKDVIINSEKKKFIFNDSIVFNKINDSELTNKYNEPWDSIDNYIKVMYNLTVENFFYPLRVHLNELKNDELDPRDLYLYEKVKIYPSYKYEERDEHDVYIKFTVRAPNYKDGQEIKQRKLRKIDWTVTERLSNHSLLIFSFSPLMTKIEAVAISCAKKGTIVNDILPIMFLQGNLDIDKEYYMFEPVEHWNGPHLNNLLNTNEITLPKSLIKPIISLDFSDNSIKQNNSMFCIPQLFRKKSDYVFRQQRIKKQPTDSNNYAVYCYWNEIIKTLEKPTTDKKLFLRTIFSDLYYFLKKLDIYENGVKKQIELNRKIVKTVSQEMKLYVGFKNINESWPFDSFNDEEFRTKCFVDHEQYRALKYSLNHHLTLVNGAPGTGKTYLACELVKLLIKSYYEYPIVVVTYKNVSLDGFLNNISDFLQKNEVSFIRIGGKPRTENQFILSHQFDRVISSDIQSMRRIIIHLVSLNTMMNDALKELEIKPLNEISKLFIFEIDKVIDIRQIFFKLFPLYTNEEESIIVNLLNPNDFIPSVSTYFNIWVLGNDFYNQTKEALHKTLQDKIDNIFNEINNYITKNDEQISEFLDDFIDNYFGDNERVFSEFVLAKKTLIQEKNLSVLFSIIDMNRHRRANEDSLKNHVSSNKIDDLMPDDIKDKMVDKFLEILNSHDKLSSFKSYLREILMIIMKKTDKLKEEKNVKIKEFEKEETERFSFELKNKKLIAMTATRAAQYKTSLDVSNCRFMIIEEAGELTESMAFSIIPKSIQNLVMIGDYRQLRPTVEHKLSFKPYNHHISLFEKEVLHAKSIKADNIFTLSIQRRMHPQISSLLRQVFYNNNKDEEKLNDDESTQKLAKPFGFSNHIQFWLHEFEEDNENIKMRSHVNVGEAKVCAYLFLMMLCRGYKSSEITIISLYKGQKKQIEREIMNLIDFYYNDEQLSVYDAFDFEKDFKDIEISRDLSELIEKRKSFVGRYVKCLDDFQGEENEVIIISLTRSEKPGFVKNENRALVTLSRARQMEFVIGNRNIFGPQNKKNPLWQRISIEALLNNDDVIHMDGISVCQCPVHFKGTKPKIINELSDFIDFRFNSCREKCNMMATCEHSCSLPCHLHFDLSPNQKEILERRYFCNERCTNKCENGHQCDEICGNCEHFGCPPCSHLCDGSCICHEHCCLHCSHDGPCQCELTEICSRCESEFTDFHNNIKTINGLVVCDECFNKFNKRRRY